jgi:hypothetical protein
MPNLKIQPKFEIGQKVFLTADDDQLARQIVYVIVTPNGLEYGVSYQGEVTEHFAEEISDTKEVI